MASKWSTESFAGNSLKANYLYQSWHQQESRLYLAETILWSLRMTRLWPVLLWRLPSSFLLLPVIFAVSFGGCIFSAGAQEMQSVTVDGYVTAVHAPDGFDVNGEHVAIRPETVYRLIGDKSDNGDGSLRDALRIGAYVHVLGNSAKGVKLVTAASVLFRDDWDKKLSGFGVIDKVIATGAEPVFQADGYRIQITPGTELSYGGGLKSLADVGTNTWIRYKGKRELDGALVAAEAKFVPARSHKRQPASVSTKQEAVPRQGALLNADGKLVSLHTKVRLSDAGGECGWHKLSVDEAMQERVYRVGMSVVPAYQKQLALDDSSKIQFRFYAVDENEIRSDLFCNDGLVLIPAQVLARLKNDNQLAALLADGVAFNVQRQSAVLIAEYRELLGVEIVTTATSLAPGFVAAEIGDGIVEHKMLVKMEEQRGRLALTLMADAGYDPRQAPEAWRLLSKKNLPKDLDSLKYPSRSGYQLGILRLQYSGEKAEASPSAAPVGLR